jgi:hypothetical protein
LDLISDLISEVFGMTTASDEETTLSVCVNRTPVSGEI